MYTYEDHMGIRWRIQGVCLLSLDVFVEGVSSYAHF